MRFQPQPERGLLPKAATTGEWPAGGRPLARVSKETRQSIYELSIEAGNPAEVAMKEEDRDELLALVSHELRAPTSAILGWVELMGAEQVGGETFKRGLEVIERNARLQTKLIEQLFDFSRVNAGRFVFRPSAVSLASVLSSSVETVAPLARVKSIEVCSKLDFASAAVLGEPDKLQQVFVNLLSNAVRFTPEDGNVEVRLSRGGASCAEVTVADDGAGIDENFIPYVFEQFRQADDLGANGREGLGLGLYIARKLVEMHKGTISAHSPGNGLGATFTVRLPIEGGS